MAGTQPDPSNADASMLSVPSTPPRVALVENQEPMDAEQLRTAIALRQTELSQIAGVSPQRFELQQQVANLETRLANHELWSRQVYQQREAQFRQVANEYHAEARDIARAEEAQAVASTSAHYQSRIGNLEAQNQQAVYAVQQNITMEARSALNAQAQQFGISSQQTIHQAQSALLRQKLIFCVMNIRMH